MESVVSCKEIHSKFAAWDDEEWRRHIFASNDPYRIVEIVREIFSQPFDSRPIRVLDVGIGYGYVTKPILDHFGEHVEVSAIEHPSVERVQSGPFHSYLAENEVTVYRQNLETGIDIDDSFDVIVVGEVIEHLSPVVFRQVLGELRSICDGYLLITTPNILNVTNRRRLLFGSDILDAPVIGDDENSYNHIYLYSMNTLVEVLEEQGYGIERQRYLSAWPEKFRRAKLERNLAKIVYNLFEGQIQRAFPRTRKRLLVLASVDKADVADTDR
ncbi:hypothetical protein GCM10025298_22270 [Natronobiforma cellulositropha]